MPSNFAGFILQKMEKYKEENEFIPR